jgi:Cu(I)/Ag(I) efflux system membrane fusion protein
MKLAKLIYLQVLISSIFLFSCGETKKTAEDLGNKLDTLTKKIGKEIDTLTKNVTQGADSLFDKVKVTEADTAGIADEDFRGSLNGVFKDYLDIKDALADNDTSEAALQANQLKKTLEKVKGDSLEGKHKSGWSGTMSKIQKAADNISAAGTIDKQRAAFAELSEAMTSLVKTYGLDGMTVYRLYCASANGKKGGYWLVDSKNTENPYGGITTAGSTDKGTDDKKKDGTATTTSNEKTVGSQAGNCAEVKEAWKFD